MPKLPIGFTSLGSVKSAFTVNKLSDEFGTNSIFAQNARRALSDYTASVGLTEKTTKKALKATKQLNFGFLSLIFGGQALKATFGGALKSIVSDFNRITGLQSEFGKATQKTQANFSFLKFAIGNALNQPFVISTIELLSDGIEYLGVEGRSGRQRVQTGADEDMCLEPSAI